MDYRVEVKVKNNNILRMLEKSGYRTVGEFCRLNGLMSQVSIIGDLVNLKRSPLDFRGNYLAIIGKMCDLLMCSPEDLFSEVQLTTALESNKRTMVVQEAEAKFMLQNQTDPLLLEDQLAKDRLEGKVGEMLSTLTPREQKVISMRFGLGDYGSVHTFEDVAKAFDCTRERIRQIEAKALRKMRNPSRHGMVRDYVENC